LMGRVELAGVDGFQVSQPVGFRERYRCAVGAGGCPESRTRNPMAGGSGRMRPGLD